MSNTIYFIAGKGGSGKDSVASAVSEALNIPVLPVRTTREGRPDDKHNIFMSGEELACVSSEDKEQRAYNHVNGTVYYATFKKDAKEDTPYIAVGPSEMFVNFTRLFKGRKLVPIVLDVSFDNRLKRMHGRDYEESLRRVHADDVEWQDLPGVVKVVNGNRQFWRVVHEVTSFIRSDMGID